MKLLKPLIISLGLLLGYVGYARAQDSSAAKKDIPMTYVNLMTSNNSMDLSSILETNQGTVMTLWPIDNDVQSFVTKTFSSKGNPYEKFDNRNDSGMIDEITIHKTHAKEKGIPDEITEITRNSVVTYTQYADDPSSKKITKTYLPSRNTIDDSVYMNRAFKQLKTGKTKIANAREKIGALFDEHLRSIKIGRNKRSIEQHVDSSAATLTVKGRFDYDYEEFETEEAFVDSNKDGKLDYWKFNTHDLGDPRPMSYADGEIRDDGFRANFSNFWNEVAFVIDGGSGSLGYDLRFRTGRYKEDVLQKRYTALLNQYRKNKAKEAEKMLK